MVKLIKLFIFSMIATFLTDCKLDKDLTFFNVDQILEKLQKKELVVNQLPFELINFLYLDTGLIEKLREVAPTYMSQKDIDLFFIDDMDKTEVQLSSKYESVEDVIIKSDDSIKLYLKESFGIENFKQAMNNNVLIFENKAFIEFLSEGSVHAITLELSQATKAKIGIAYITVD